MSRRKILSLVVVAIIAVVGVSAYWLWPRDTLNEIIAEYGFVELTPPTKLSGVGTINVINSVNLEKNVVNVTPVCVVDSIMIKESALESETETRELEQKLSGNFDVSAQIKSMLSGVFGANYVRATNISFRNVKVIVIPDTPLRKIRLDALGPKDCYVDVVARVKAGQLVCQTQKILRADLVYKVEFEADSKTTVQRLALEKLKAEVGGSETSKDTVAGKSLHFGIDFYPFPLYPYLVENNRVCKMVR